MVMNKIDILKEIIIKSQRIVVMTGAGFSVPSGIPDFRSSNGVYNQAYEGLPPEVIISHSFYKQNPKMFYKFYKEKMIYPHALPNIAHKFLQYLEEKGKLQAVITQNIDGLDIMAGTKNVLELHGSIHRNYCEDCHTFYDLDYIMSQPGIPYCEKCKGIIKPDVVLYEEPLDQNVLEQAITTITNAQVLIVVGTSLNVQPAAGLVQYFQGRYFIIINLSSTCYDKVANLVINEPVENVFGKLIKEI